MLYKERFDVIVIGGGHAGTEAALASARVGVKTLLLTHNIETLGQMSCNPAIGGIGKSHLVREVDAMGGAMALATDKAGIQFRVLNARKGPAVRATRAQADRQRYKIAIRAVLENQPNLTLFQQAVDDLIVENTEVKGVVTNMGLKFMARKVILTTGTFLGGTIHIGLEKSIGGRAGDPASIRLADRLRELPLRIGRLKTGTPPRIDSKTVDFTQLEEQWGDKPMPVMSFRGDVSLHPEQRCCWITHTNEKTHDIIRQGLDRSPMFTGEIEGIGPRYCPSIEDKIHRFADKMSHQIFIEPEGLDTHELYPNGISTSLPFDVQLNLVRSIKGFENAHIMRAGYAIEYDYFDPRDLQSTLETKVISGLFFAGQINGTTGYEEAASQGLLAGINAALQCQDKSTWSPRRDEAYIGVLVDDLITMGAQEPYRMFTSRAEYRLLLREDNADLRLTEKARQLGLIDETHWRIFNEKKGNIDQEMQRLKKHWVQPDTEEAKAYEPYIQEPLTKENNLHDLLKRPEITFSEIKQVSGSKLTTDVEMQQVETQIKYAGYIARQQDEIDRLKRYENTIIPEDFDYAQVKGLSNEVQQKLTDHRPHTLAQAGRVQGVTPAAISLLLVYLKKQGNWSESLLGNYLESLAAAGNKFSISLNDQQKRYLDQYLDLLVKWNKTYNLTAIKDKSTMIERHIVDSLSVAQYISETDFLDVGTGPGLPGVPLSIVFPEKKISLLDSNGKKTRFLNQVKLNLSLENIEIIQNRVEIFEPVEKFSAIISRAFSDISDMIEKTQHLLKPNGVIYAMKGQYPQKELASIQYPYRVIPLQWQDMQTKRHLVAIEINQ